MVLLSASICSKSGKALVSRQFMEVTRSRIEGLLAAFPKLINAEEQHTFVETENVRYVYQPLEQLYVVLITTRNSNILEDLETLRLFAKVIPEYCKIMTDREVCEHAFELIWAFDEIVALGYRENVNLSQIRTFTEMESHDENIFKMVKKNKEREAHELMKRRAKELTLQKRDVSKTGSSGGFAGGFGSGGSGGNANGNEGRPERGSTSGAQPASAPVTTTASSAGSAATQAKDKKPGRGMKLGGKAKATDFVDALRAEGQDVAAEGEETKPVAAAATQVAAAPAYASTVAKESVHIRVEEKITLEASRDGGLENMEVKGIMQLVVSEASVSKVRISVTKNDDKVPFQTHPNVDKKLFASDGIIGLKNADKSFPLDSEVGVVKWRFQTSDESFIPLTINCWPTINADGSADVNIDYELLAEDLELHDVVFSVPLPGGTSAPVIKTVDGQYQYNSRASVLDWKVALIDGKNKEGSLEFSVKSGVADDFFPVSVMFVSSKTYAGLEITGVAHAETGVPVAFSKDVVFTVDKYHIV